MLQTWALVRAVSPLSSASGMGIQVSWGSSVGAGKATIAPGSLLAAAWCGLAHLGSRDHQQSEMFLGKMQGSTW